MRQPFGETLVAGDAWNWQLVLSPAGCSYSSGSPTAAVKYFFRGLLGSTLDIAGSSNTDGSWSFSASGTQTLGLAGECSWQLAAFDADNNRTEIARGSVTVLPDIQSASGNFDGRSWARTALDVVNNVLAGRVGRVEKEYQIAGRHVALLDPDVLLDLRAKLEGIVNREMIKSGQKSGNSGQVLARFGPRRTGTGLWNK